MSKNCINCITETRNGPDLLCDHCRNRIRVIKDEKGRPCIIVGGKEHTMDHHSMMELIKEASESVGYDAHTELVRVRSKCVAPALFQLEKIRTEKLAVVGLFDAANYISHARVSLGDTWPLVSQDRHGYSDELEKAKEFSNEILQLLQSVHLWFMKTAPEKYSGCGLWIDVDTTLREANDKHSEPAEGTRNNHEK